MKMVMMLESIAMIFRKHLIWEWSWC